MSIDSMQDKRVLALRIEGRSFGAIARELRLEDAATAYAAYQQALWNTPPLQRASLQSDELDRLDRLAAQLREQHGGGEPNVAGQIMAIERLRALQLAEWRDRDAEWPDRAELSG
jgi:hypothetical protein